ncbi:MAG: hypothetical protein IKT00_10795 [Prevotella sp.]|nr:hypothetical protein [Prevotella sp.]
MRKLIICMALGVSLAGHAVETDNDTVVINKPKSVTIITGDSIQKIEVVGREGNDDYRYENSIQLVDSNYVSQTTIDPVRWTWGLRGFRGDITSRNEIAMKFGVGMNAVLNAPEPLDFSTSSSFELMWTIAQYNHYLDAEGHHRLSTGFALDWRNYRMTGTTRFDKDADGHIIATGYPEGARPKFSRIKVLSLSFPIEYCYQFNRHFGFGIGPVLNWNVYGSIKTKYKTDGGTMKDLDKRIHQNPFTIDWMLHFYNPSITFYVKYSPMNVLQSDWGPKFQSISFGIEI